MASLNDNSFSGLFPPQLEGDDCSPHYHDATRAVYGTSHLHMGLPTSVFGNYVRSSGSDMFPGTVGYDGSIMTDSSTYAFTNRGSPGMYTDDVDPLLPSSNLSSASAPSVTSSNIGSPQSYNGNLGPVDWSNQPVSVGPSIMGNDFATGTEYSSFTSPGLDEFNFEIANQKGFVGEYPLLFFNFFHFLSLLPYSLLPISNGAKATRKAICTQAHSKYRYIGVSEVVLLLSVFRCC